MKMPKKFLWGCASAACQMEGGFQEDQKSLSIADIDYFESGEKNLDRKDDKTYLHTIHQILENQSLDFPKRRGNNFYHHYKEDIALLADMGIHAYRFSIAWTRIFPNPDDEKPNVKGLQFYDHVVDECLKYNIEPVITLSHFDTPLLIATKYGGWSDKAVIPLFQKYCKVVFYHFKRRVKYWISFNEINAALEIPFTGSALISGWRLL